MMIDLTSLEKAVEALQRAIRVSEDPALVESASEDLRNTVRAGVIQNFEFTYELCWKMLKRHLEAVAASCRVPRSARPASQGGETHNSRAHR